MYLSNVIDGLIILISEYRLFYVLQINRKITDVLKKE